MNSPDYKDAQNETVLNDFLLRIQHYEAQYQTLDEVLEAHFSFMKIFNTGAKILVHRHEGHIQSRIIYYLMNIHILPRTIYLTRVTFSASINYFMILFVEFSGFQFPVFFFNLLVTSNNHLKSIKIIN